MQPTRAALRLLKAMGASGVAAISDPTRDGYVVLRASHHGVSLGRGTHPRSSLDELLRRDLACPEAGSRAVVISEAGRAWLAREKSRRSGAAGDAFADQHRDLDEVVLKTENGPEELAVNTRESPLAWLRRRRGSDGEPLIDAAQFEAGERLRRDLTFAGMLPSVTARWDGAIGGGQAMRDPAGASDAVIAARQRVRAALLAIGAEFADLLVDLCGFLKGVETIERERRWPARSGKIVIGVALGQLARHYGLASEARGRAGAPSIRIWIAEAAQP